MSDAYNPVCGCWSAFFATRVFEIELNQQRSERRCRNHSNDHTGATWYFLSVEIYKI